MMKKKHQVTGSPSFLALSQKQRGGCQLHEREACQAQVRCELVVEMLRQADHINDCHVTCDRLIIHHMRQAYLESKMLECQCWPLAWKALATPETKVTFDYKKILFIQYGNLFAML